jgi:hypothetical protein
LNPDKKHTANTTRDASSAFRVFVSVLIFLSVAVCAAAKNDNRADSIMKKVFENRDFFKYNIDEYFAKVYIKGINKVVKKNRLYRFAPDFLYMDNDAFIESIASLHYKAPNFYSQQIDTANNPNAASDGIEKRLMQFLQVNIYNPALINNKIRLPGAKGTRRYYRFEYLSTLDTLGYVLHVIAAKPKIRSQQLVSGLYYIIDGLSMIFRIDLEGKREFAKFRIVSDYNAPDMDFLLPSRTEVYFTTHILKNLTESRYTVFFDYTSVKRQKPKWQNTHTYNMSEYFIENTDALPIVTDESFWKNRRPEPLTPEENELVAVLRRNDSIPARKKLTDAFAKNIVAPRRFNYAGTQMKYSGFLNPLKISYSKLDGLLYWQQMQFFKTFDNGHELQFSPSIGFLLQKRQVYFKTPVRWLFQPRRFGEFYFNFENRNQAYNSKEIEEELQKDSVRIEDILDHFNHLAMNVGASYEIANGMIIKGGMNFDRYIAVGKKEAQTVSEASDEVAEMVTGEYRVFMPSVGVSWTPGMYYRVAGKRKYYIRSSFPTVSADYVCGWKIFGSDSDFSKVEIDLQQKIGTGLMSTFQYYLAAGKYLNARSMYFTNFSRFQRRHFPESWNDPIGGVFHLLGGEWYDASRRYVQAHLMFEFPYTLFRPFRGITKDILKERIYLSHLCTPLRPNYTEIGYGVGNYIGNIALFVAFDKCRYQSIGMTFVMELDKE